MNRSACFATLLLPVLFCRGTGDDDLRLRVSVNLVQVDATVTGAHGESVRDLKAEDFELLLDGKPQPIAHFGYIENRLTGVSPLAAKKLKPEPAAPPEALPAPLRRDRVRRTTVLFVDDMTLSAESAAHVRAGARKAIETGLQPGDLMAIVRAGAGMGALQDFSNDKQFLLAAAERIRWNPSGRGRESAYKPYGIDRQEDLLFDTPNEDDNYFIRSAAMRTLESLQRVVRGMSEMPSRKTVIVLSDYLSPGLADPTLNKDLSSGGPTTSDNETPMAFSMRRVIDQALRAGVVICAIDTRGLSPLVPTAADNIRRDPLGVGTQDMTTLLNQVNQDRALYHLNGQEGGTLLASETGGVMVLESNDIGRDIGRIEDVLSGYYVLGFTPPPDVFNRLPDGKPAFHHLTVSVKRPGVKVRTRSGFFGEDQTAAPPDRAQLALATSLESPFGSSSVRLGLDCGFLSVRKNRSFVRVNLVVDAHDLSLAGPPQNRSAIAHLLVRAFNVNGAVIEGGIDELLRVSLNEEGYARAMKWGLVYSTTINVEKPGPYQFRAAMLDQESGRVGTANQFLEVPDLSRKGLALSSVFFAGSFSQADQITPALQPLDFHPGQRVPFAFEIFGAPQKDALEFRTRLYRDGKPIAQTPEAPVPKAGRMARGEMAVPADAEPGEYFLQVELKDPSLKRGLAWQWARLNLARE